MRRTLLNGQFQILALSILALLAAIPLADVRADEKSNVQSQIDEKKQAIYDLQQKLIPLLRDREIDAEAQKQAAELELRIAALTDQLAKLSAEGAAPLGVADDVLRRAETNARAFQEAKFRTETLVNQLGDSHPKVLEAKNELRAASERFNAALNEASSTRTSPATAL
jgi:hypothetical protein